MKRIQGKREWRKMKRGWGELSPLPTNLPV